MMHGAPGGPAGLLSSAVWRLCGDGREEDGDEGLGVIEELLRLLAVPRQCPVVAASLVQGLHCRRASH